MWGAEMANQQTRNQQTYNYRNLDVWKRAQAECRRSLAEAREAMGLTYFRDATSVKVGG